jgi:UDP-N-acetyl-D-galactosamine dehydrogenase
MNRYKELIEKQTKIAVIGLNKDGIKQALNLSQRHQTLIFDEVIPEDSSKTEFLFSRGLQGNKSSFTTIELATTSSDLRGAGVFYLNGLSNSIMDWASIKRAAVRIAQSLTFGDWIVLGPHIDPDLTEVVVLEIIERNSGLKLGHGFEIAFHPSKMAQHNFTNTSNELKMSHNLIVKHVEEIFNFRLKNEFGTNQISYQNIDAELVKIESHIKTLWIPMLNDMTRETFLEFIQLSMNTGFLDAYGHLKLSTESHVNWRRFFRLVLKFDLKEELTAELLMDQNAIAI